MDDYHARSPRGPGQVGRQRAAAMEIAVEEVGDGGVALFNPAYFLGHHGDADVLGELWHQATADLPVPRVSGAGPPLPWWARSHASPPAKPVLVGTDLNGGPLYVGRAWHEGHLLPAKVAPEYQCTFVAWSGREHTKYDCRFEVLHLLRGRAEWIEASDGVIPAHAFPIGITTGGRTAYSTRAAIKGIVTPGRIVDGDTRCYVSYDGKEWSFRNYEVLAIL